MNELPFPYWHDEGGPGLQPGGWRRRSKVALRQMFAAAHVSYKTGLPSRGEARICVQEARQQATAPRAVVLPATADQRTLRRVLTPAKRVRRVDAAVRALIASMVATVQSYGEGAIGLAAPQLGVPLRVIVVQAPLGSGRWVGLVNPEVVAASAANALAREGCLSLPGVQWPVLRATTVRVQARDAAGRRQRFTAHDDFARVLQHEIDHCAGRLLTDYQHPADAVASLPRKAA